MRWQHFDELEADFQQYYGLDIALVKPARAARLLFQLPRNSRVYVALSPSNQWGWDEILASKSNYLLETLVWMKTKDAQKKAPRNRPKPFVPEFMKLPVEPSPINNGAEAHYAEDISAILAKPRV